MAAKIMDITQAEVLAQVAAILSEGKEREPGTFTTAELAEYLDCCIPTALGRIKKLLVAGIIENARIPITDLAGRQTTTFGFRYIGKQGGNPLDG